ncbi:MAG TPA: topoisomerase C-terminal repeat-containing protein, partial [Acidimicrobiales bacterium]|nr:topoisomerase C-terminal repeat-containing protein [Acidimicrobiales bacterium]
RGEDAEFATSGKTIEFPGFLRAYVEGSDDPNAALEDQEVRLPALAVGDGLLASDLVPKGHATQPPARYTEASLVKALEELGVGRPSTYASIIENIQARGYVWKRGAALIPAWTAFAVIGLLEQHFSELVDYGFTAQMEEELDEIANGTEEAIPWLARFYFGDMNGSDGIASGLKKMVHEQLGDIDAREINSIPIGDGIVVRVGKYGPYIQRDEGRAAMPEDLAPDELTVARAEELLGAGSSDRVIGPDPTTALPVLARAGRFGPYVQLGDSEGSKPKTQSLLEGMALETVTLEQALQLLSLPRVLGADTDGEVIEATHGRYGPYLKKGTDSRSLANDGQLFTVTLEEARALFAQPKPGRGARSAAALRELGPDPVSGQLVTVKEGRFGPYVTDGVSNASLRKGDTVDGVTLERAAELLANRREAAPTRTARKGSGAKKTAAKKPAAKKNLAKTTAAPAKKAPAAKKTAAKKSAAKKTPAVKKATSAKKTTAVKATTAKKAPPRAG